MHHDSRHFGVTWKDTGKLFLLDQAYCSHQTWFRIDRVGAFFVTRLPIAFRTTVERSLRSHRGRARDVVGLPIWEALEQIERRGLDVECPFRVHIGRYRSTRGRWETHRFRVVAIRHPDSGAYHVYVTNIPPHRLSAENIGLLYRLRWEVELSYRGLKSEAGLAEVASRDPAVVKTLVLAALVRSTLSLQVRQKAEQMLPADRWVGTLTWQKVWNEGLNELLPVLAEVEGARLRFGFKDLARWATCPDRKRVPLRCRLLRSGPKRAYI